MEKTKKLMFDGPDTYSIKSRGLKIINTIEVNSKSVNTLTKKVIPLNTLRDKAQKQFNLFIRSRDAEKGCISCKSGKVEQASHFYSAGQFTALRFNEDNCHGSCLRCNYFLSGNLLPYRAGLLKKIGEQRLNLLLYTATRQMVKRWDRYELEIIYQKYKNLNKCQ